MYLLGFVSCVIVVFIFILWAHKGKSDRYLECPIRYGFYKRPWVESTNG
jgi:hypothetical protein